MIPEGTIPALLAALAESPGAIPGAPVADTLKRVVRGFITDTIPGPVCFGRKPLRPFGSLLCSRPIAPACQGPRMMLRCSKPPARRLRSSPGSDDNIKLTYPEDLVRLERIMAAKLNPSPVETLVTRIGTGFDVHRLQAGRPLFLCGVRCRSTMGLAGHSDADVGIHALCDAIYGALAEGDIGRHFPPSEATWKDADSARFLAHAAGRIAERAAAGW